MCIRDRYIPPWIWDFTVFVLNIFCKIALWCFPWKYRKQQESIFNWVGLYHECKGLVVYLWYRGCWSRSLLSDVRSSSRCLFCALTNVDRKGDPVHFSPGGYFSLQPGGTITRKSKKNSQGHFDKGRLQKPRSRNPSVADRIFWKVNKIGGQCQCQCQWVPS